MNEQKKWELLKYAYDNYPKGTKFKSLTRDAINISSGIFIIDDNKIKDSNFSIAHSQFGWAEIVSDRKPLLTSEDGVDLYEGDKLFEVNKRNGNSNWYLVDADNGLGYWTVKANAGNWNLGEKEGFVSKAFSSEESALKWIEEQKPKEIVLFKDDEVSAVITKHKIKFNPTTPELLNKWDGFIVSANELEQIYKAYKELS